MFSRQCVVWLSRGDDLRLGCMEGGGDALGVYICDVCGGESEEEEE